MLTSTCSLVTNDGQRASVCVHLSSVQENRKW